MWGSGGHGRVVAEVIQASGNEVRGYIDRDHSRIESLRGYDGLDLSITEDEFLSHLHTEESYPSGIDCCALGIGNNEERMRCLGQLGDREIPCVVHPGASVSRSARIGRGSVVFPHAVINAGARVGEGVIINSGSIVEHDCVLADGSHLAPGAVLCGGVSVGEKTWIGAGATVVQNTAVGRNVMLGAGATVVNDIPDGVTAVGSPARVVKSGVQSSST